MHTNIRDHLQSTTFDPKSIMLYPIPKAHTLDNFFVTLNTQLSSLDKILARAVYPQPPETMPPSVMPSPETSLVKLGDIRLTDAHRYIGQRHNRDWYAWEVRLLANPAILHQIEYVRYHLHPTFRPNKKDVRTDRQRGFPLRANGWGHFTIGATVFLKKQRPLYLRHNMQPFRKGNR